MTNHHGSSLEYDQFTFISPYFSSRDGVIPTGIVLHCLGLSFPDSLCVLSGKSDDQVSAHYFVPLMTSQELMAQYPSYTRSWCPRFPDRVPVLAFQSADDPVGLTKAWHAGISVWRDWNRLPGCERSLNACTIGIEFQSEGYARGGDVYCFGTYTLGQRDTGVALIHALMHQYAIPQHHIVAHSDIAWERYAAPDVLCDPKTDPGPTFFWEDLFMKGIGILPTQKDWLDGIFDIHQLQQRLRDIGYTNCPLSGQLCPKTQRVIDAYRMHFLWNTWCGPRKDPFIRFIN